MKSIFDKDFIYTPSHATDIRRTFERIRKAAPQEPPITARPSPSADPAVAAPKVTTFRRRG